MAFTANVAEPLRVAVIADAHVYDMTCDFGVGAAFDAVMWRGRPVFPRPWQDTRAGARAYNESASALAAALEMVMARGIRHVVLLGDYTDDGQRAATAGLAAMLGRYAGRLAFYAIPGNHDLYATHGKHQSMRVMARDGAAVLVTSDPSMAEAVPGAVVTPQMYCAGAAEALQAMAAFGLCRQPGYVHWETPFGAADGVADGAEDGFAARAFDACSPDGRVVQRVIDASYLVEPEPGLWLLMIDANVFEPRNGRADPARKRAFVDPSAAGWNAVLRVKPHLIAWIADVCARARLGRKTLLVFSHYPVLDPHEDVEGSEAALFGVTEVGQRRPLPEVAVALKAAGVEHIFTGHLHVNGAAAAAGLRQSAVPSLVSFPPGFCIAAAGGVVERVSLGAMPLDPDLAAVYGVDLAAERYGGFLQGQLRLRTREHRMQRDWPPGVAEWALGARVADLRALMGAEGGEALDDLPLPEVIADWYALRQAGGLAVEYVSPARLALYARLAGLGDAAAVPELGTQAFFARFLAVLGVSLRRVARGDMGR